MEIIEKGLSERDKNQIGLKWPLANAVVKTKEKISKELQEIIKLQLNVKKLKFEKSEKLKVNLDLKLTPELEAEGYARQISRQVQSFRKDLKFEKKDKINLFIETNKDFVKILKKNAEFIKKRTNAKKLEISSKTASTKLKKVSFKIKDKKGEIGILLN